MRKIVTAATLSPKAYWKLLQHLKEVDVGERDATNPISAEQWVDHCKGLLKKKRDMMESDHDIITDLAELEREKVFDDLSFKIRTPEIECDINELKVGKATGSDGINADIIKASCPLIIRYMTDLFNHILTTGSYPNSWGLDLITSIQKKRCPSDLKNYRGITVSSCLDKLIGLILCKRLTKFCNEKSELIYRWKNSPATGKRQEQLTTYLY